MFFGQDAVSPLDPTAKVPSHLARKNAFFLGTTYQYEVHKVLIVKNIETSCKLD